MSTLRDNHLKQLRSSEFDVLIVGAGINGAVSAAALSAKGAKVALIDRGDFGGFTSANSSNLVWGGIKYLENHEYRLVNTLCQSRNELMQRYPSTVKEIRFLTCIQQGFRFPPFFVYLGALLYWLIGRCFTAAPAYLRPKHIERRSPIINTAKAGGGLEYSDAYLFDNDSRFVFNFVRSAMDAGCVATNYVSSRGAARFDDCWHAQLRDEIQGETFTVKAKVIINACGPFVDTHNQYTAQHTQYRHVFSKGVHLIVDRITDDARVLTFFASDGRLFFVIPMGRKTCIGTTDTRTDDPYEGVSDADRQFILDNANRLLNLPQVLTKADIIAERCGVRPLAVKGESGAADWLNLSRKHKIECNDQAKHLSIFGGKLTDCINVGEEVAECVAALGVSLSDTEECWYGEPDATVRDAFFQRAEAINLDALTWEGAAEPLSQRYWRRYGKQAFAMLDAIEVDASQADIVIEDAEYTRCEILYTRDHEMIVRLEDFLRRRSKTALVVRRELLEKSAGLKEVCRIFFGDAGEERFDEYFDSGE